VILKHNLQQILRGVLCTTGGLLAYGLAYLFFWIVPPMITTSFGYSLSDRTLTWVAVGVLLLISVSGYRVWRLRGGFYGYHESELYHDLGTTSGSGMAMDHLAHRVTGPAYLLSQVFLGGPLLLLRAVAHFRNWIASESGLNERLSQMLANLKRINKWQGLHDHPGREREIILLARMGLIDVSTARGNLRFKAGEVE